MIKALSNWFNYLFHKSPKKRAWRAVGGLTTAGLVAGAFQQFAEYRRNVRFEALYTEEEMQESFKGLYRELFVGYSALGAHGNKMAIIFHGDNLFEKFVKGEKDEKLDLMIAVSTRNPAFIELKKNIIKDVISPLGLDFDLWMKTYDKLWKESEEIKKFDFYTRTQEILSLFSCMDLPQTIPESLTDEVIYELIYKENRYRVEELRRIFKEEVANGLDPTQSDDINRVVVRFNEAYYRYPNKEDYEGLGLFGLDWHYMAYYKQGAYLLLLKKEQGIEDFIGPLGRPEVAIMKNLSAGKLTPKLVDQIVDDYNNSYEEIMNKFKKDFVEANKDRR